MTSRGRERLYEATRVKKFFAIHILPFPWFQVGLRKRNSALMARQCLAWPRRAVNPREPGGSRRRREGLTANGARQVTMMSRALRYKLTAFLLIFSLVEIPIRLFN